MIGVGTWYHLVIVVLAAILAMLVFAAGTQGYFITRNKLWETVALLLIAFILFRPGYFWDQIFPPLIELPPLKLAQVAGEAKPGSQLRLTITGEKMNGDEFV